MSTQPIYAVPGEPFISGMVMPPGVSPHYGAVALDDERTRHFVWGLNGGLADASAWFGHADTTHLVYYTTDGKFSFPSGVNPKGYLGYDGSIHSEDDPVNQWADGLVWMKACGIFAHHIAEYRDHYHMLRQPGTYSQSSFTHSDESNLRNQATLWWGRALNGEAFRRLVGWMPPGTIVDDPEIGLPSVIPEDARPHENWKLAQSDIASLMKRICDNCLGQNILRRFHRKCRPLDYLAALGSTGVLTVPDFTEDEWRVRHVIRNMQTLTPTRRTEIWDELMEWNGRALDYFDENIAPDATHL